MFAIKCCTEHFPQPSQRRLLLLVLSCAVLVRDIEQRMGVKSGMTVTCKSTHQPRSLAAAVLLKFSNKKCQFNPRQKKDFEAKKESVVPQVLSRTRNTNYVPSLFTVPSGSCKSIRYKQTTDRRLLFVMVDDDDEVQGRRRSSSSL